MIRDGDRVASPVSAARTVSPCFDCSIFGAVGRPGATSLVAIHVLGDARDASRVHRRSMRGSTPRHGDAWTTPLVTAGASGAC